MWYHPPYQLKWKLYFLPMLLPIMIKNAYRLLSYYVSIGRDMHILTIMNKNFVKLCYACSLILISDFVLEFIKQNYIFHMGNVSLF